LEVLGFELRILKQALCFLIHAPSPILL
jgi:hypothetical protein